MAPCIVYSADYPLGSVKIFSLRVFKTLTFRNLFHKQSLNTRNLTLFRNMFDSEFSFKSSKLQHNRMAFVAGLKRAMRVYYPKVRNIIHTV